MRGKAERQPQHGAVRETTADMARDGEGREHTDTMHCWRDGGLNISKQLQNFIKHRKREEKKSEKDAKKKYSR